MYPLIASLLLALSLFLSDGAAAQERWYEAVVDNDALTGFLPGRDPSDREYTHGMWLALEEAGAPVWGRLLPEIAPCPLEGKTPASGRCLRTRTEAGLKIFTPDYRSSVPERLQRPYAGYLYAAVTGRVVAPRVERSVRAELGMTGRATMAEYLQRVIHEIANYQISEGWKDQLTFEPGLLLRYRERWVIEGRTASGQRVADVIPAWQASLGNVHTGVQAGVTARAGYRLPHPWLHPAPDDPLALYGFLSFSERWTLHDLFLDGNTFHESAHVDKRAFAGVLEFGAGVDYRRVRFTASVVREDRLYETQPNPHLYVTTTLSYAP